MLHFWTDSRMVYVEKRRENTAQIASSACLRSSRSIGQHYVNVLRKKQSVQKVVKKISHLQTKIGDTNLRTLINKPNKATKNFTTVISFTEQKRLGLQRNLIFNQGIKNIWVFEVVVVVGWVGGGGRGGEGRGKQKNVRTSGKLLATPLIRTQMID